MFFKKKNNHQNYTGQTNIEKKNIHPIKKGIAVLGLGCPKCNELKENVQKVIKSLSLEENVYHITDIAEIVSYGVMSTPAFVIDGNVISAGRVLSENEIKEILKKYRLIN